MWSPVGQNLGWVTYQFEMALRQHQGLRAHGKGLVSVHWHFSVSAAKQSKPAKQVSEVRGFYISLHPRPLELTLPKCTFKGNIPDHRNEGGIRSVRKRAATREC